MWRAVIASDPVPIDAPIDAVWAILADVDRYAEWNPFARTSRETERRVGRPIQLEVRLSGRVRRQTQRFEAIEAPERLVWGSAIANGFLLRTQREQRLRRRGETGCVYLNSDTFEGPLAPLVMLLFGTAVRRGFAQAGQALKRRAEAREWDRGRSPWP